MADKTPTTDGKPLETDLEPEAAVADDALEASDEDDAKLVAADEDDDDAEDDAPAVNEPGMSANRKRRLKRREQRRRAVESSEREMRLLREENSDFRQRLSMVEGHAMQTTTATVDQRLAEAAREVQQAEYIISKAIEAGNGEDTMTAMRLRDEARDRAQQLANARDNLERHRADASKPRPNTRVVSLAQEWAAANPWYRVDGSDEASAITKAIDTSMAREGLRPEAPEYWHELTRRVAARLAPEPDTRRKAPPTGGRGEHVSASAREDAGGVTDARRAAMVSAGIWDDPVRRDKQIKAYRAYDKQNQAR